MDPRRRSGHCSIAVLDEYERLHPVAMIRDRPSLPDHFETYEIRLGNVGGDKSKPRSQARDENAKGRVKA